MDAFEILDPYILYILAINGINSASMGWTKPHGRIMQQTFIDYLKLAMGNRRVNHTDLIALHSVSP